MALKAILFAFLGYGPVSMLCKLFILYCIWNWRSQFNNTSYELVKCDILINIFVNLNTWTLRVATLLFSEVVTPAVLKAEAVLLINDFWSPFFFHLQAGSRLVKSAFRLNATRCATSMFWEKYYVWIYLGVCFISFLLTMLPYSVQTTPFNFTENVTDNASTNSSAYIPNPIWNSPVMDFAVAVYTLITTGIGVLTRRQIPDRWIFSTTMKKKVLICTIVDVLLFNTVWLCHFLSSYLHMTTYNRIALQFFASDLISCSSPFILIALDAQLKRTILDKVFGPEQTPSYRFGSIIEAGI